MSVFGRREQRELRRRNAELERQVEWLTSENAALAEEVSAFNDENKRLKCCGNCGNHDDAVYSRCAVDGHAVPYSAACKFDPSRWTGRSTP